MDVQALLTELFGRIPDEIHGAVDGLSADDLAWVLAASGRAEHPDNRLPLIG